MMNKLINRIKLAKKLLSLSEIVTEEAVLIYEGVLAEGTEVFIEDNEEILPAPDGEYTTEGQKITVADGKVTSIEPIEVIVEAPVDEVPVDVVETFEEEEDSTEDEKDVKIAELEATIAEKDAAIAELEAKVAELESKVAEQEEELSKSTAQPAKEIVKQSKQTKSGIRFYQFEK